MQINENNEIVIDELKLCYLSDQEQVESLVAVEVGSSIQLNGYIFYRVLNERFRYFFEVIEDGQQVAQMKYGH